MRNFIIYENLDRLLIYKLQGYFFVNPLIVVTAPIFRVIFVKTYAHLFLIGEFMDVSS